MLRHLRVTNFAILSDVALDFGEGLSALTGETGAGKSLIVDAVNLLRGGRASADIPRAGADEAVVEAIFDPPADVAEKVASILADAGLPHVEGELLVRRVIHSGGRSRTYINGALTTATRLSELGALLVDLSGQHQHQGLVDPKRHREILDAFAESGELVVEMSRAYAAYQRAAAARDQLAGDERDRVDRIDYLRFQLDEIEAANLTAGEDEALAAQRRRLQAAEKLRGGAQLAEEQLYSGDGAAVDTLGAAAREVSKLAELDPSLAPIASTVEDARALAEDAATELRRYTGDLSGDPARLAEVEDRLDLIHRLARKHGPALGDVIARADQIRDELSGLENWDERLAELEGAVEQTRKDAETRASELTRAREQAATRLVAEVRPRLVELGMKAARLSASIEPRELGPDGGDKVELLLASNKGERAKPLARIASGGELSRIMLALKLVLRRADAVATYVFDEVDAGIGGAAAEVVGRQIRGVANARQVLCVTHLPQIAAFADTHFHVSKIERRGRTETLVEALSPEARREEMARMLGGLRVTDSARAHADELLQDAAATRT